ncbi:hypothetical protein [Hymenobacter sp. BT491]|uniref:hypothetical protein n=1 Tax=Hymenobacter sp. BT491 TaxID=2766779 RepID=UPI0016539882|nr:hypothetical protein [Hymenobacter sp. BT491]MBC6992406.1 hypothetical protein [Hymenobacter sp. BT491]
MKTLSTLVFSLGLFLQQPSSLSAAPARTTFAWQTSAAETAYNQLGDDAAAVVQRALGQTNDAAAIAILIGEGAKLQQRAQQLKPSYTQWISTLKPAQAEGVRRRVLSAGFTRYFGTLDTDPQLNNRIKQNPDLNKAIQNVMNTLGMAM